MPKLRPAPKAPEADESTPTYYGAEKPAELFESKDEAIESNDEIDVVAKAEPPKDDNIDLKKQIEDLRRAEKAAREEAAQAMRDREVALARANERERESFAVRQEVVSSRLDAINAGITAAQAEAETAQRDLENAVAIGDTRAQAEAYRKLARAEANLSKLEDGKAAIAEEIKQSQNQKPSAVMTNADGIEEVLANSNLPETAKSWLRAHPDYMKEPRKNAKIQALHWDIIEDGLQPFSQEYFESMEVRLGLRKIEKPEDPDDDGSDDGEAESRAKDRTRGAVVSAPVSREAPGGSRPTRPSQIHLTKAQVEAARMAGVTEAEYAKQLIKLGEFKSEGHYGETR